MKKIFVFILSIAIIFTSTTFASALAPSPVLQPAEEVTAQLVDDSGNVTLIVGELINSTANNTRAANSGSSATYSFSIYENQLVKSGSDSTLSSYITLTIYYNEQDYNNVTAYLLTRVNATWAISDAHTSVTHATLNYGCSGFSPNSGFADQHGSIDPATYLGGCTVYTEFDTYVVPGTMSVMGATLILDYARGSRTWTFTMQNLLFND